MAAVDVGIRHQDDLAVAQLARVKILAESCTERGDHRAELLIAVDLVQTRLLDVQHLAPERQNRLITAVASLLGRAARRVALDDVDLGERRIALLTVGQLARQTAGLQRTLSARHLTRLARRLPRTGCGLCLVDDNLGN